MDSHNNPDIEMTAYGVRKQGGRTFDCEVSKSAEGKDSFLNLFGIFNGYNGDEAADYARTHIKTHIVSQDEFWCDDDNSIFSAIRKGFISCQDGMWHESRNWPRTSIDFPSMSGTGASVVMFTRGKMFIGHVGDSKIILGYKDPKSGEWKAKPLTKDHLPGDPLERYRIEAAGGRVCGKGEAAKVIWRKPNSAQLGDVTRSGVTLIEEVPLLPVSRSLGDLWSYNYEKRAHIVTPVPDVTFHIIHDTPHFLILGSKGLWKVLSPEVAVNVVSQYLCESESEKVVHNNRYATLKSQPSKRLVNYAVQKLPAESLYPEIISAVTVLINPSIHFKNH